MFRRSRAAIVLALLFTASTVGVPAPAAAGTVVCDDEIAQNYHVGDWVNPVNGNNNRGIKADIKIESDYFYPGCTDGDPAFPWDDWGNDGPSAWVAITPGPGNPMAGQGHAILQMGIINCNAIGYAPPCTNTFTPHFFWARGGCGTELPVPLPIAGTVNDNQYYSFAIRREDNPVRFELKIDGVLKQTVYPDDAALHCWITEERQLQVFGETLEQADHIGTGNHRTVFWDIRIRYDGSSSWNSWLPTCIVENIPGEHMYGCTTGQVFGPHATFMEIWTKHQ